MRKFRMPMISNTLRKHPHELADQLPADATWDDVIEEARFRKAVEAGFAAADRGAFLQRMRFKRHSPAGTLKFKTIQAFV